MVKRCSNIARRATAETNSNEAAYPAFVQTQAKRDGLGFDVVLADHLVFMSI